MVAVLPMSAAQEASACQGRGAKSLHLIRKRASAGTSKGHGVAEHGQGKSHVPMPRKCASTTCMDYVCIKVLRVGGGVLHLHALTVAVRLKPLMLGALGPVAPLRTTADRPRAAAAVAISASVAT